MLKGINLFYFTAQDRGKFLSLSNKIFASAIFQKRGKVFTSERLNFLEEEKKKYENTFGDIESFERKFLKVQDDSEDVAELKQLRNAKGKSLDEYKKEIYHLIAHYKYKEAIKVLEVDMVNDRVKPDTGIYRILFSYTAQIGDLKEAYRLYVKYKEKQGRITGPMYTSLFNACANCKNSFFALERAHTLRKKLYEDKLHKVNIYNYNAMLKAFGRHGDIPTCLKIFDEVLEKRLKAFMPTYNFLLQSCISDKNSGLRHALLVWRKLLQDKKKPDIFFFNLFLRCVRDCSLGDVALIPDMIKEINNESGKFFKRKAIYKKIGNEVKRKIIRVPVDGVNFLNSVPDYAANENKKETPNMNQSHQLQLSEFNVSDVEEKSLELSAKEILHLEAVGKDFKNEFKELGMFEEEGEVEEEKKVEVEEVEEEEEEAEEAGEQSEDSWMTKESIQELEHSLVEPEAVLETDIMLPDLLAFKPTTGSVVEFQALTKPFQRIMLFGGVEGFVKTLEKFNVQPNPKTISLLLSVSLPTVKAEQKIFELAKAKGIQLDAPFFSQLLKRRIFRGRSELIKETLEEMQKANVQPDLMCFGVLAFACDTLEKGRELLDNLKLYGYRPNSYILYGLLVQAERAKDLTYVKVILDAAKADAVELNAKFIAKLGTIVRPNSTANANKDFKKEAQNIQGD